MIAVVFFGLGAATARWLWASMGESLRASPVLQRENYRGAVLPVACGVIIALTGLLVGGMWALVDRVDHGTRFAGAGQSTVLSTVSLVLGFTLLGMFDDVIGDPTVKGFRGHVGALGRGTVTTGLVKLVGGVLLGFLWAYEGGPVSTIRGGLLIAATANLANLFDRAPGRVTKVSLLGALVLVALTPGAWLLAGPLLVVGAAVGLLAADLKEELMLGDTGANALGAAIGFGLVLSLGTTGEWVALVVVVALNLVSEKVSFSRVIDRTPPLRRLDRLGTLPERRDR